MPAKDTPTKKRIANSVRTVLKSKSKNAFKILPTRAHTKNTWVASKRSEIFKKAKSSVPTIKPSCTIEVSVDRKSADNENTSIKSVAMLLPANQSDVQQN